MKILVVEDEKNIAQILRRGLEEEGHAVSLAADGRSALELAESSAFDLLLLDVMLPGMDGLEVARRLRGNRQDTPNCARDRFALRIFGGRSSSGVSSAASGKFILLPRNFASSNSSCGGKAKSLRATPSSEPSGVQPKMSRKTLWMLLSGSFVGKLTKASP